MSERETIEVRERNSAEAGIGGLVVSAPAANVGRVSLVVGRPGLPNIKADLEVGDAVLFETPDEGLFEVRALSTSAGSARLLVTQVSHRRGIMGGLVGQDPSNEPFRKEESARIRESLDQVYDLLVARFDIADEKLDYVARKLDEIGEASERLGRKDWLNLAIGTLTSTVVNAALGTEVAKALFEATQEALSWLLGGGAILLLP